MDETTKVAVLKEINDQLVTCNERLVDLFNQPRSIDPYALETTIHKLIGCTGVLTCQVGKLIEYKLNKVLDA